eukprot:148218_1
MNTKKNVIGVMFIGIGTYGEEIGDRCSSIKKDIQNLSHLQNIDTIQFINDIQTCPHSIHKTKWSDYEVIQQLEFLRKVIGNDKHNHKYDGYILIYVSHGNNKGNQPYSITSNYKSIPYKTIRNSIRNASDIPPLEQHKPRMAMLYSCQGAFTCQYSNNNYNINTNNQPLHQSIGNNFQNFTTASYDKYFIENGVSSEINNNQQTPDSNIYIIQPSLSNVKVSSWPRLGSPPVMSFCHYISSNIGKEFCFYSHFRQQCINDITDMHKYIKNEPVSVQPFSHCTYISKPP